MAAPAVEAVQTWAREQGVDLRAAVAAAAGRAALDTLGATVLQLVANGRDVEVPGSSEAPGMFWYFRPLPLAFRGASSLASEVYVATAEPLVAVRAAMAAGPGLAADSVSFNYTKSTSRSSGKPAVTVVGQRDVFHFRSQIEAALTDDGSLSLLCSVRGAPSRGQHLIDAFRGQLQILAGSVG
jgi:hypothetical protein